jgi:transposase
MRYIGIDVASETHVVAVVNEEEVVLHKPTPFKEEAAGYQRLREIIGSAEEAHVGMEATGHYWQNLFAFLIAEGFQVSVVNPLRTRRFAEEDLKRAKTDAIDSIGIARFLRQKRPAPTVLPSEQLLELRELVRLRDRLVQDMVDRVNQLHRVVDLGFPEFTGHVKDLSSSLATALLELHGTAQSFAGAREGELANVVYDGRRSVGRDLARELINAARVSVGKHHGPAYDLQATYACQDIRLLRDRIRMLEKDIHSAVSKDELGTLLTTIDGIGPNTSARIIAEAGDPANFASAGALAAYIGAVPHTRKSGKRTSDRASMTRIGHAKLRAKLWMPTLVAATKLNPWLRSFYDRLISKGKPAKVALVACMRKLIAAIYSVAKNRRPFVPRLVTPTA